MDWQTHIVSDKEVLMGKPTVKGTRISVELILELLSGGWTEEMILKSYPSLTKENIMPVFSYLRDCIRVELYYPISKIA